MTLAQCRQLDSCKGARTHRPTHVALLRRSCAKRPRMFWDNLD